MKLIKSEAVFRILYCLLAVDGHIDEVEIKTLHKLARQIDPSILPPEVSQIMAECRYSISDESAYNEIENYVYKELQNQAISNGLGIKGLLWNMLAVAYCDDDYSENERRLIHEIARVEGVEETTLKEMEEMVKTLGIIQSEKEELNQSSKTPEEKNAILDELDEREKIIANSIVYLVNDDNMTEFTKKYTYKKDVFDVAGDKIGEASRPAVEAMKTASQPYVNEAMKTAKWLGNSVTDMFKRKK